MTHFKAHQRGLALLGNGVATCWDSCGLRMYCVTPPHPPTMENQPEWGQAEQKRGAAIAKIYGGEWTVCQKSVDLACNRAAGRMALYKTPPHFFLNIHASTVFIHGFGVFIHGLLFVVFVVASSFSFSFTNEKKRGRELIEGKSAIHELLICVFNDPRTCYKKSSKFVDESGCFYEIRGCFEHFVGDFAIPWIKNIYKSMGYKKSTDLRPIHGEKTCVPREPTCLLGVYTQGFTLIHFGPQFSALMHNSHVSLQKLIGFSSLKHRCDASRSSPADRAASLSVPPFLAARMGGRKLRRFAQAVPGLLTRSSCRLHLVVGAVVFTNRTAWRPHMARQHTSSFSPAREELLQEMHADAQTMSLALSALFDLLRGCAPDHQVGTGGLLGLLEPIAGGMETLVADLGTARHFGVQQ